MPLLNWPQVFADILNIDWLPHRVILLASSAIQKTREACRPTNKKFYHAMFRLFVTFSIFMKFSLQQVGTLHILAYLGFLAINNVSASSICSHISAIKELFAIHALDLALFSDQRLKYLNKAKILNRPFKATLRKIIYISTLEKIVYHCSATYMGPGFQSSISSCFIFIFMNVKSCSTFTSSIHSFNHIFRSSRSTNPNKVD